MDPSSAPVAAPGRARGLLAALTVLVVAAVLALPGCGNAPGATAFRREGVNAPTADPFTDGFGTDRADVVVPENVTGAYTGAIPGLYGGGGSDAICDPAALVGYLAASTRRAAAWAGVLHLAPSEIAAYVARLTPVVLRADTAVTDHGYEDGKANRVPTVLQTGTAVLVDDRGVAVVQCASGNPLTAAASTDDAIYEGPTWAGFTPETVITVEPAVDPVTSLVIADPTGTGVRRPVGTSRPDDTPYVPGEDEPGAREDVPAATSSAASGAVSTTYVANVAPQAGSSDYPLDVVTDDCVRARFIDRPFTITVRLRDDGVGPDEVTVPSGTSSGGAPVALFSPTPTADLRDDVAASGTFSAGATRIYDGYYQGDFTARWSGKVAGGRDWPGALPLTIRQTWHRDRDSVAWLNGSGGPDDFTCSYQVTTVRRG